MADQPKVTISFTVTLYQAALHMALHDLLNTKTNSYDDLAPQTVENYAPLVDEITDNLRMDAIVRVAQSASDSTAKEVIELLKSRLGYTIPSG